MSDDVLVRVENVSKRFCRSLKRSLWYSLQDLGSELGGRRHGGGSGLPQSSTDVELRKDEFWAVKDVSFELRRGECLGLIGRNGAGKTTLLKMLNGLIKPDSGSITMHGRVGALIALGAGFNPILTGRENIYINGSILGLTKSEIDAKISEVIDFAEIGEFIDTPVQNYSSGMNVRLGFAVATALEPDVLILDEVLAVGDMAFHAKCYKVIGEITKKCALIFVSHDLSSVARICDLCMLLSEGQVKFKGDSFQSIHLYNQGLRESLQRMASTTTHMGIRNFSLQIYKSYGIQASKTLDCIRVKITVDCTQHLTVGRILLSFYQNAAIQVGQADVTGCVRSLSPGIVSITIEIPQLNLATGNYTLNFAMFGIGNRETLIHAISCAELVVEDAPYLGSAYKMPARIVDEY
jgi:lipopolysaccharide transport system ATP-binding protein